MSSTLEPHPKKSNQRVNWTPLVKILKLYQLVEEKKKPANTSLFFLPEDLSLPISSSLRYSNEDPGSKSEQGRGKTSLSRY